MALLGDLARRLQNYLPRAKTLSYLPFLSPAKAPFPPGSSALQTTPGPPLCIPAVSCHLSTIPNLDGCCINDPSGHFLQTQFWDTSPAVGANDTWTIHGLWPDYCKGGFDAYCAQSRSRSSHEIAQIVARASKQDTAGTHPGLMDFMNEYWLSDDARNDNLWAHEWNKHGTCISTLEPTCYTRDSHLQSDNSSYAVDTAETDSSKVPDDADILDYFTHTVLLYTTRPTFEFFAARDIVPSYDRTYSMDQLQSAISGSAHGFEATIKCRNHNELSEIWYHFNTRGSLRGALGNWDNKVWDIWVPTEHDGQRSNCPDTGIRYLPKKDSKQPGTTTSMSKTQTHTATATVIPTSKPSIVPFTGKGHLMVKILSETSSSKHAASSQPHSSRPSSNHAIGPQPIPNEYTGCLIRKGSWYMAKSLTSCATFTAHDDAKSIFENSATDDTKYHLFTLESRLAPCAFIPESIEEIESNPKSESWLEVQKPDSTIPLRSYFACDRDMPFQSILSNNVTIDRQHTELAKRLTVGSEHQTTFYATQTPLGWGQEKLYTDSNGGERGIQVEIYWEAL